jgi:hypothetical protein
VSTTNNTKVNQKSKYFQHSILQFTFHKKYFWSFTPHLLNTITLSLLLTVFSQLHITHFRSPIRKPCFEYLWGRTDCPTAPSQDIILEFPGGWMTSPQMFSYFQRTFNFAKAEVASNKMSLLNLKLKLTKNASIYCTMRWLNQKNIFKSSLIEKSLMGLLNLVW